MRGRNDPYASAAVDSIHILLVEDRPEDAFVIEKLMRKQAPSGQDLELRRVGKLSEAIDALNEGGLTHCVLLDLSLPDSRGLRTLNRLRAVHSSVPILVLSGVDDEQTAAAAVRLGAHGYLAKQDISRAQNIWESILEVIMSSHLKSRSEGANLKREGILRLDNRLRIMRWDEHCELLTGWTAEQVEKRHFHELVPSDQRTELRAMLEKPKEAFERHIEIEIKTPDNALRRIELAPQLSFGEEREQQWVMSEPAEVRHGQQAAQMLSAVLSVTSDLVFSIDLDGRIRSCNPAAEKLLATSSAEIVDQELGEVFGPAQKARVQSVVSMLRRGSQVRNAPCQLPTGENQPVACTLNATPIRDDLGGLVGGCLVVCLG